MFLETLTSASLILASATAADVSFCARTKAPVIQVGLVAPKPIGDYNKSVAELETFHIDTKNPYGAQVDTHVGGLTSGTINVKQQMTLGGARRGETGCLWVDAIQVTIRLDQTVYVAKDYAPGTCLHNAVWDHEHKHVRVDREIINKYRPIFDQALRQAAVVRNVYGPFPVGSIEQTQGQMMQAIEQVVAKITQDLEAERSTRQQAIDTRAEYDRVSNLCRGRKTP